MQNAEILKYDNKTRQKRFCFIILGLYFSYYILNIYLNIKIAVVNYLAYPFLFYFCGSLFNLKNEIISEKTQITKTQFLSFIKLVIVILVCVILLAWLPALFMNSSLSLDLAQTTVVKDYLTNFWLLIPWPAIIAYVGLYAVLVQQHGLNDIVTIANKILPGKIKNDTVNNAIIILHSCPYMAMICFSVALIAYCSYLVITSVFNMVPFMGVTLTNLLFVMFLFVLASKKQIKTIFRAVSYSSWSIAKFLMITAIILLISLLLPTVVVQLLAQHFAFDQKIYLMGGYNYQQADLNLVYQCLVSALWWFCAPIIGMCCYKQVRLTNYKQGMILGLLAFCAVYFIINFAVIQQLLVYMFSYSMSFSVIKQQLLLIVLILGLLNYFYRNKYDKNAFSFEFIDVLGNKKNKHRAASKAYYYYFLVTTILLLIIILENIFLLQKLIAYGSIINTLLLVVMIRGYFKYIKAKYSFIAQQM